MADVQIPLTPSTRKAFHRATGMMYDTLAPDDEDVPEEMLSALEAIHVASGVGSIESIALSFEGEQPDDEESGAIAVRFEFE